jgi:hydrophobic/amphiphilic exporter-1 (mainly G- bacteria), HAE1 family
MGLINSFVHNPIKVAVGVLLVALFGLVAVRNMPMQLTPEVQIPTITVETRWPGASPQEVEQEIVLEQEEQLKGVEGVTKMSSESMDSLGRITLEFIVGTNMDRAVVNVIGRLEQVTDYPEEAKKPVISTTNANDRPIAWFILSPRFPRQEQFAAFAEKHPHLRDEITYIANTHNEGLAMLRLRTLARANPEVEELLPPKDFDVTKMRRFAEDEIEALFERVEGVSQANVLGGLEDEMQVVIDPQKLAARQLTITDVRQVLISQNADTSSGDYWEGKRRWVVRTLGQFRSPEQVAEQFLAVRDGAPVYIRDVAEVRHGFKKPDGLVRRFGESSISLNALRETGANVLDVMRGLQEVTRELNEGLLKDRGLELTQVYDETEYIVSAVALVRENIFIGSALTMIVLMSFLHLGIRTLIVIPLLLASALGAVYVSPWFFGVTLAIIVGAGFWFARGALVVGLAIPISIIGTFLVLGMLGRSLNVISLAGMAFAVGMLVDNAVVVLENIYRRFTMGEKPFQAAAHGTQEVWGAIVSSTLTTIAVFLPIVFIEEEAGQLFRDIALAISAAVALSLIISMTVIPTAAARLFHGPREDDGSDDDRDEQEVAAGRVESTELPSSGSNSNGQEHEAPATLHKRKDARKRERALAYRFEQLSRSAVAPIEAAGSLFVRFVVALNTWVQGGVIRRLGVIALLVGLSVSLSYAFWPRVEYLPTGNRNLVFGILLPPPGYNLDELMDMGETVEQVLRPYWDVDPDSPQAKELDYPIIGDFFFVARGRQVFMGVRSLEPTRVGELVPLIQAAGAMLPGTFTIAKQSSLFEQGLTAGRTIDVEITGPDLEKLVGLGGRVLGQVGQLMPDAQTRPVPSLDLSSPELHVRPRLLQAAEMGVTSSDLGYTTSALVDGAYSGDYFLEGKKIDLTIIGKEQYARSSQDVRILPVATPIGQLVPLESLAEVELRSGPEQVNHRERLRAITIEVSPAQEMALEDAMALISNQIVGPLSASGELPAGYRITLAGTADKLRDTWSALQFNVFLALLITYLLMAALFESWLYPFVIILTVPLGAVGGILGLALLNQFYFQPLDVLTMLGFVILIGTVVNNPILIVHQSLNHIREDNMTMRQSIIAAVRTRIRPIFMTTITTVLGLLPLVLFPGAGSELYRGLGSVVLGGLLVSTIFTLFLVPALFSLTMETKDGFQSLMRNGIEWARNPKRPAARPAPAPAPRPGEQVAPTR